MKLTKEECKNCTVENMCTTGTVPNSDECMMKWVNNDELFNEEFLTIWTNSHLLTKEECERALDNLKFPTDEWECLDLQLAENNIRPIEYKETASISIINQLINEHFDNQPLKFEKLCEDEPIFDKKHCCWRYVMQKDYDNEGFYDPINDEWIDFEEDRFFAREVK